MKFTSTKIDGVWVLDLERHHDVRGWFARTWCADALRAHGLQASVIQCSSSFNARKGTLRGMHYQSAPHQEAKIVRCTRGAAVDVALDLRPESPTFCQWISTEITADNGCALYIPKGCAHGFQTLEDETEIFYMIDTPYAAGSARGARWNDPAFGIVWPLPDSAILSPRDANYPDFPLPNGR